MANIEVDGPNKTIKVDSGNLTLDIPGDIILDADGANVTFKDGGTSVLDLSNSSTDAVLTVSTQDKDLIIKGDDGGSAITAATFDMSDAGTLILNHDLVVADAGKVGSASATDAMTISSGGIVTFKDDILIKDGGTIGVASVADAMTVSSGGIVTFKDDILIKDAGTIGSASDADAIAIASNGVVTFSQAPVFPDGSIAVADLDIDGATDIGAAIVDADLFVIDDGAGGTNRKTTASRLKTYVGGGITEQDMWRITADAANPSGDITANWERCDTDGFALLGTGLTESSGIFSFPSTGHWLIMASAQWFNASADERYVHLCIQTTEDNSSYSEASQTRGNCSGGSSTRNGGTFCSYCFDVTNTTNDKFKINVDNGNSNTNIAGDTNGNETFIQVMKLADT